MQAWKATLDNMHPTESSGNPVDVMGTHGVPGSMHEPVAARPEEGLQLQQLACQEVLLPYQAQLTQHPVIYCPPCKQR